jgi:hypothetical protein
MSHYADIHVSACDVINYPCGYIDNGSAPPSSRRCGRFRAGFPSRHAREKRFWRPISPKLSGRHFFGVTVLAIYFSKRHLYGRSSHGFQLPKLLKFTEDVHPKNMSTFEADEHLLTKKQSALPEFPA